MDQKFIRLLGGYLISNIYDTYIQILESLDHHDFIVCKAWQNFFDNMDCNCCDDQVCQAFLERKRKPWMVIFSDSIIDTKQIPLDEMAKTSNKEELHKTVAKFFYNQLRSKLITSPNILKNLVIYVSPKLSNDTNMPVAAYINMEQISSEQFNTIHIIELKQLIILAYINIHYKMHTIANCRGNNKREIVLGFLQPLEKMYDIVMGEIDKYLQKSSN